MGNAETSQINFEHVQDSIQHNFSKTLLINTLSLNNQNCVIFGTKPPDEEEQIINDLLENKLNVTKLIIYGKNCRDATVAKKLEQFRLLGLLSRVNVQVYTGGLFEWILLQEIYGTDLFKTATIGTNKMVDLLKYK